MSFLRRRKRPPQPRRRRASPWPVLLALLGLLALSILAPFLFLSVQSLHDQAVAAMAGLAGVLLVAVSGLLALTLSGG
jgi:hypothetical protein